MSCECEEELVERDREIEDLSNEAERMRERAERAETVNQSLAADWEQVCEAAGIDTDATANEVIETFQINRDKLSEALFSIYDHGSAPNAHVEAGEIIKRLKDER